MIGLSRVIDCRLYYTEYAPASDTRSSAYPTFLLEVIPKNLEVKLRKILYWGGVE